jgi:hypothetical protein
MEKKTNLNLYAQAPMQLTELKKHLEDPFGRIGKASPGLTPAPLVVEGEPKPFDTEQFRRLYKISSCPEGVCHRKCDEHYVRTAF